MNNGIVITPAELRASARLMKNRIESMKQNLDTASRVMQQTTESFDSPAAKAMREKYEELKKNFPKFYQEMTSYAEFLETTASEYERTNQEIENAARG